MLVGDYCPRALDPIVEVIEATKALSKAEKEKKEKEERQKIEATTQE